MKVTISFHIAKTDLQWRNIANHVKHLPNQYHANKDIQFDLTKFNSYNNLTKQRINKFYEHQPALKNYISAHDAKVIKQGHKKELLILYKVG